LNRSSLRRALGVGALAVGIALAVPPSGVIRAASSTSWARLEFARLVARSAAPPGALEDGDAPVDRGTFVSMLVRGIGAARGDELWPAPSRFTDVGARAEEAALVEAAAELGLVRGYGDGTFRPRRTLTRAELTALLVRAASGVEPSSGDVDLPFVDAGSVPPWARGYVEAALAEGLVRGYDDGTFRPGAAVTLSEGVALLSRFLEHEGLLWDAIGVVRGVDPQGKWVRLRLRGGGSVRFAVAATAATYRAGRPAEVRSLIPYDQAFVIADGAGAAVHIETYRNEAVGALHAVDDAAREIVIEIEGGRPVPVEVSPSADVFKGGRSASLRDLAAGDRVYAIFDSVDGTARLIDAVRVDRSGRLEQVDPDGGRVLIAAKDGTPEWLPLAPGAVVFLDGRPVEAHELEAGATVEAATVAGGEIVYMEVLSGL